MLETKRIAVSVGTIAVWLAVVLDALSATPSWYTPGVDRMLIAVAICGTGQLMLWMHERPLADVWELGYEMGRRDQMREANGRTAVSPIRRVSGGFTEFNTTHAKRINGHKIEG